MFCNCRGELKKKKRGGEWRGLLTKDDLPLDKKKRRSVVVVDSTKRREGGKRKKVR